MRLVIATMALLSFSIILSYGELVSNGNSLDDSVDNESVYDDADSLSTSEDEPALDLYELDSPRNGTIIPYVKITAYCLRGITRSGTYVSYGTAATDRNYIPQYTRFMIEGDPTIYTSLDTGSAVIGWHVDKWMPSCYDAIQWGVRYRQVELLN